MEGLNALLTLFSTVYPWPACNTSYYFKFVTIILVLQLTDEHRHANIITSKRSTIVQEYMIFCYQINQCLMSFSAAYKTSTDTAGKRVHRILMEHPGLHLKFVCNDIGLAHIYDNMNALVHTSITDKYIAMWNMEPDCLKRQNIWNML